MKIMIVYLILQSDGLIFEQCLSKHWRKRAFTIRSIYIFLVQLLNFNESMIIDNEGNESLPGID